MATIKKVQLVTNGSAGTAYDIGADADNITYDSNGTKTNGTVAKELSNLNTNKLNKAGSADNLTYTTTGTNNFKTAVSALISSATIDYSNVTNTPNIVTYSITDNTKMINNAKINYNNVTGTPTVPSNIVTYTTANNTKMIYNAKIAYSNVTDTPDLSKYLTNDNKDVLKSSHTSSYEYVNGDNWTTSTGSGAAINIVNVLGGSQENNRKIGAFVFGLDHSDGDITCTEDIKIVPFSYNLHTNNKVDRYIRLIGKDPTAYVDISYTGGNNIQLTPSNTIKENKQLYGLYILGI